MPWVTKFRKPVWKKYSDGYPDFFLFYSDSSRWMVGTDHKISRGSILTLNRNLDSVPVITWKFYHEGNWTIDHKLRVQAKGLTVGITFHIKLYMLYFRYPLP